MRQSTKKNADVKGSLPENTRLAGSERPRAQSATLLGTLDDKEQISITFVLRSRPDGPPLPDHEHWRNTPPGKRKFLSVRDFTQIYGASKVDLDHVAKFAEFHGMKVLEKHEGRAVVIARGTAAQMNSAFGITLNRYESPRHVSKRPHPRGMPSKKREPDTQQHRGFDGSVHLPPELAGVVTAVFGLDNRILGGVNGTGDPTNSNSLDVPTIAQLYNFPTTGAAGQTIGIFNGGGNYDPKDIKAYINSLPTGYQTQPTIKEVDLTVDGTTYSNNSAAITSPNNSDYEITQDIETASAIAQGATVQVYCTISNEDGWLAFLNRVMVPQSGENTPVAVSSSWFINSRDDSSSAGQSLLDTISKTFAKLATLGISIFIATGDEGANSGIDNKCHVQYAGSDPWVTSCGGTMIGNIQAGPPSTFDEYVWSDESNGWGATSGGVSDYFPAPSWQTAAGVSPVSKNDSKVRRGVPDIAGMVALQGLQINKGSFTFTGTSCVDPLYVGLTAVLVQALGEPIGFLNPTLYALGNSVCRDITYGNNDPNANPDSPYYTAGAGWDACSGWGVIDGNLMLEALKKLYARVLTFIMQRTTFGNDEVAANGTTFNQAFFITVDGLKPSDFPGGGITTLSPSSAQLNAWAPSIPDPTGPAGATNITITPTAVSSDNPSLSPIVQRFTFTYQVNFPDKSAFTSPPASDFPEVLSLKATLVAANAILTQSQDIELLNAADPFFASESNGGLYWLSEDIRTFYAVEGSTLFGAPALGNTPAAAQSFIQWIIKNIAGADGMGPNGDSFENTLSSGEESSALSLLPVTMDLPAKNIYNFAIARVRLNGLSEEAKTVRAFFRLFQSQSVAVPYQTPLSATGVSAPTGAYRQWSDGMTDSSKTPLLGISSDGSEYITVPCFASPRVTDGSASSNMTTQSDPPNVQEINPVAGETVYAYFGCWIDNNQSDAIFPLAPGANPDGPFTDQTLNTVSQVIDRGGHQCLVVQIVDDEAPIINNATPGTSDKIAQRNLAFTVVANPGLADSRLATHTFEVRPSTATVNAYQLPDEMMIDWGNVPKGSVASIYLPAVAAADVVALADELYAVHHLTTTDAHTLQCPTGGTVYVPIPQGSGPNLAGLFSVQLPLGIKHGEEFRIVVRQITGSFDHGKTDPIDGSAEGRVRRRFVYGTFQISIPVSIKSEMLIPEERNLSVLRWIQRSIPATSRWFPVFSRYIAQLSGRVTALGGSGNNVPPTQSGIWPGLLGPHKGKGAGGKPHCEQEPQRSVSFKGKIDGVVYDHFGDFEAFILETFDGEKQRFRSNEAPVHRLVQQAWRHRIMVTITVHLHRCERPIEIILHGAPPPLEQ